MKPASHLRETPAVVPPTVGVTHLTKLYPGASRPTFKDLTVACPAGKVTVIVGPSGCGKTTLLRCICGLEPTTSGRISFDTRDVTDVPPEKRGVAMVFQNYALYPDKTVEENIAFPLRMAKIGPEERRRRVDAAARLARIEEYLGRRPAQLSGGQRQRVGIARAIVRGPQVLLMDEPLSNLDTKLRIEMRAEFAALQRQIGATTVYVTHDQTEALTLADHLILMHDGVVEQQGAPGVVFGAPTTTFVADFMGRMNLLTGSVANGKLLVEGGGELALPSALAVENARLTIGFRPEETFLSRGQSDDLIIEGKVVRVELLGTEVLVHLVAGSQDFRARLPASTQIGDRLALSCEARHVHRFDASGKRF